MIKIGEIPVLYLLLSKANSYEYKGGIWGSKVSPPMFGTMEIFGKATCILRLEDFKKFLK